MEGMRVVVVRGGDFGGDVGGDDVGWRWWLRLECGGLRRDGIGWDGGGCGSCLFNGHWSLGKVGKSMGAAVVLAMLRNRPPRAQQPTLMTLCSMTGPLWPRCVLLSSVSSRLVSDRDSGSRCLTSWSPPLLYLYRPGEWADADNVPTAHGKMNVLPISQTAPLALAPVIVLRGYPALKRWVCQHGS